MPVITVTTLREPDLAVYANLTGAQLRNRLCPAAGMVSVAVSPQPEQVLVLVPSAVQVASVVTVCQVWT